MIVVAPSCVVVVPTSYQTSWERFVVALPSSVGVVEQRHRIAWQHFAVQS